MVLLQSLCIYNASTVYLLSRSRLYALASASDRIESIRFGRDGEGEAGNDWEWNEMKRSERINASININAMAKKKTTAEAARTPPPPPPADASHIPIRSDR